MLTNILRGVAFVLTILLLNARLNFSALTHDSGIVLPGTYQTSLFYSAPRHQEFVSQTDK